MQGCWRISFRKPRNAFHLASAILLRRNDRPLPSKEPWSFCTFRPTRVRRITLTAPNDLSFDGVQSAVSDLLHLGVVATIEKLHHDRAETSILPWCLVRSTVRIVCRIESRSLAGSKFGIVDLVTMSALCTIFNIEAHVAGLLGEYDWFFVSIKINGQHLVCKKPVRQRNRHVTVSDACQQGCVRTIGHENSTKVQRLSSIKS